MIPPTVDRLYNDYTQAYLKEWAIGVEEEKFGLSSLKEWLCKLIVNFRGNEWKKSNAQYFP
ncbi:hypothetical protein QO000_002647 [Alkalihalobacillus hemicentroti]|uniref:Uncharacterized protein n=1 Tax=Guptibacillus hwajinpoensis TaxID=208199 RepID=A0ABU0K2T5_9BACL|nr:hypothetical protein [Alkalihalobacillus hemicentroti]